MPASPIDPAAAPPLLAVTSEEFAVRARNNSLSAIIDAFDEASGKALKRIVEWIRLKSAAAHA